MGASPTATTAGTDSLSIGPRHYSRSVAVIHPHNVEGVSDRFGCAYISTGQLGSLSFK